MDEESKRGVLFYPIAICVIAFLILLNLAWSGEPEPIYKTECGPCICIYKNTTIEFYETENYIEYVLDFGGCMGSNISINKTMNIHNDTCYYIGEQNKMCDVTHSYCYQNCTNRRIN